MVINLITPIIVAIGVFLSFTVTNSIRMKEINMLRQQLSQCRQQHTECRLELTKTSSAYEQCIYSIKKLEIDYSRKLKQFVERTQKTEIARRYEEIKPDRNKETCENLKAMLDKLVEVESR